MRGCRIYDEEKVTYRERLMDNIDRLAPSQALLNLIEPHCLKSTNLSLSDSIGCC